MWKRVLVIVAAVLVVGFVVYVGVSAANGSYTQAAGIGAQDVTAVRQGNAVLAKMQAARGVKSATFAFTSQLVGQRKSAFAVKMDSDASLADVDHVAELARKVYNHAPGNTAGAVVRIEVPGAPALTVANFSSAAQLLSNLAIWKSIPQSTGTSISVAFGDRGQRTLAVVSTRRNSYVWMAKNYTRLKTLSAKGFTWTNPGGCILSDLPNPAALALMIKLSAIVPVACNSAEKESILLMESGVPTSALLTFVTDGRTDPVSAHASQFARVANVLLSQTVQSVNVGFFGSVDGKPTALTFFAGTCTGSAVASPYKEDAASLSILKSHGVDIAARATLGVCLGPTSTPTATPTG